MSGILFFIFTSCEPFRGYYTLILETLCIFLKNKATLDKVSYGSGQKCSKELKITVFPSIETIVVKLQ